MQTNEPTKIQTPKTSPALRRPQVLRFTQDSSANHLLRGLLAFSQRYGRTVGMYRHKYVPDPDSPYQGATKTVKLSDEEAQVAFEEAMRRDLTAHLSQAPSAYASMKHTIAVARAEAEDLKAKAAKAHIAPEHLPIVFAHSQRSDVAKVTYRWPLTGEELEDFITHTGSARSWTNYVEYVDAQGVTRRIHRRSVREDWDYPHRYMVAKNHGRLNGTEDDGGMVRVVPYDLSVSEDPLYRASPRVVAFSPSGRPQGGSYGQAVQTRRCVHTLQQWLDRIDWCEWLLDGDGGLEAQGKRQHALRQVRNLARQARMQERTYTQAKASRERLTTDWLREQQHQADLRMGEAHNVLTLTQQRLAKAIKEAEAVAEFEAVQAATCEEVNA